MNKEVLILALFATTCFAQQTDVQPDPTERPSKPFSNVIPERTAWVVKVIKPWELRGEKEKDPAQDAYLSKFAGTIVKSIDNAYASGIRREVLHYADDSKFTRYVAMGQLLYEDRLSGEPIIEDPAQSATGPTWGVNRFGELAWVSDKYYIGVASYQGRACYVYRQFSHEVVLPQDPNADPQESSPGAAANELKDPKSARILATAFIDKETMQPVAYETIYEVWLYKKRDSFQPFGLPGPLQDAARKQAEAVAKMKQKYNIRQ
jgi:hypothetical protein